MSRRLKVLLSAYACEPDRGSEPEVGWNWVKQISRFHEVWAITRANNREPIERVLGHHPIPNVHWVYFDLPRWMRFWKKGERGVYPYYYLWQVGAYFVGKKLHRQVGFDLVHHVTFANYWLPSFLALLPVPFVWGPVGGGESTPKAFYKTFSPRSRFYEYLRNLVRWLARRDVFVRLVARRAEAGLGTTDETAERLRGLGCQPVQVLSQVALPDEECVRLSRLPTRQSNPFCLMSIGRLRHSKGCHLGLMAFAQFHKAFPASQYWFIGDGPERKRLERLAYDLGVPDKVRFWGGMPRSQVLERIADCDVLVHPSLHDSGGWVCAEAMGAGRPVICLDLGGPALQVTQETGVKIPAVTPEQVVNDLAEAMLRLAQDSHLRTRMGEAGRKRVTEHFHWRLKGQTIANLYTEIIGQ